MEPLSDILARMRINPDDAEPQLEQPTCPKCNGMGFLRYDVPYGDPNFGKLMSCGCKTQEIAASRANKFREMSHLGPLQQKRFENFDLRRGSSAYSRDALQIGLRVAQEYAANPQGWLVLTGPSGTGKSTLLNLICGVVSADEGAVEVLGTDLGSLSRGGRDRFRAEHVGVVFQMFNLVPYLSIIDNVLLPLRFAPERARRTRRSGGEEAEARRLLAALALDPALHPRPVTELSVGQQQRVAAARALVGGPELLIADEPTSALDQDRQAAFLSLLFGELERIGATLIMVSHDIRLATQFDEVVRLDAVATVSDGAGERSSRP